MLEKIEDIFKFSIQLVLENNIKVIQNILY